VDKKRTFPAALFSWMNYREKTDDTFYIPETDSQAVRQDTDKNHREHPRERPRQDAGKPYGKTASETDSPAAQEDTEAIGGRISKEIGDNIKALEGIFNSKENKDVIYRRFCIADGVNGFLFYVEGMIDKDVINLSILKPLLDRSRYGNLQGKNLFDFVYDSVIETHQIKKATSQNDAIRDVLTGDTAIFIDGYPNYILCETKGYEKRSVDKPQVEGVVKGPQEAFNENLRTNITLIRRILRNNELTTEFFDLGERNNAKCAVVYINKLVNPAIVAEVIRRIKGIRTDLIIGDGILEQFIEDHPLAIIPTMLSTERPDRTSAHLVEGKVAILADGSPFALVVPVTFADFLHTPEDTWLRWQYGTFLRLIRFFALFIASMLPGMYVALTTFHREMIPTDLLIAIAKARENVPFPTIVEVLLMEISFELIREAGIRIPGIIGNTIGIIGALILGQAAVQANLVSPVLIIIVAFTGLGSFAIPDFSLAFSLRIIRIFYILVGALFGFYGISLGILVLLAHIVNLNSFGVPIFSALAPKTVKSRDLLIRWPVWKQEFRPDYLNPLDITRQPKISRKWTKANSDPFASRTADEGKQTGGRKSGGKENGDEQ
jgi:spore germination protein KA